MAGEVRDDQLTEDVGATTTSNRSKIAAICSMPIIARDWPGYTRPRDRIVRCGTSWANLRALLGQQLVAARHGELVEGSGRLGGSRRIMAAHGSFGSSTGVNLTPMLRSCERCRPNFLS